MQVVVTKHHGLGNDFLVLDLGQLKSQQIDSAKLIGLASQNFGATVKVALAPTAFYF